MASSSIDLCAYPAAAPPDGGSSNFDNPVSLAATVLSVEITLTSFAALIVASRIYVNWTQLHLADCKFTPRSKLARGEPTVQTPFLTNLVDFMGVGAVFSVAYTAIIASCKFSILEKRVMLISQHLELESC